MANPNPNPNANPGQADRRDDVHALGALGAVPALLNDAPLLAIFGVVYKQVRVRVRVRVRVS